MRNMSDESPSVMDSAKAFAASTTLFFWKSEQEQKTGSRATIKTAVRFLANDLFIIKSFNLSFIFYIVLHYLAQSVASR